MTTGEGRPLWKVARDDQLAAAMDTIVDVVRVTVERFEAAGFDRDEAVSFAMQMLPMLRGGVDERDA